MDLDLTFRDRPATELQHERRAGCQSVFCDEAGFSGNNLLDAQPYFVYVAAAIDEGHAKEVVDGVVARYKFQAPELKGTKLLRTPKGRMAVNDVLRECGDHVLASVNHKKYALACKFFEYIFEPVISEQNSLFYACGFHKFIATALYSHFAAADPYAELHLKEFQEMMRMENQNPPSLFGAIAVPELGPTLAGIRDFARIHRTAIQADIAQTISGSDVNWILDLTTSALNSVLAEHGQRFEQMTVICDPSKPLKFSDMLFGAMINRHDRTWVTLGGMETPLTYNLSGPLQFGISEDHPGIQVADVCAAAFNGRLLNAEDQELEFIHPYLEKAIIDASVWPNLEHMNLRNAEAAGNAMLLMELVERSQRGIPLLANIRQSIELCHEGAKRRAIEPQRRLILP